MQVARTLSALLLTTVVSAAAQTSLDLPDIGDPAAAGLTLSQERRLGPVILRQIRSQLPISEDVELNEYLSSLGGQLLATHADNQLDFHFLLVRNSQINAFATPGGIVVINSGLILASESESELAGVLAHEVTHVTQRHLARLIAESKQTSWVGYLAAIGTVLAAVYDSRLAQLGVHTAAATSIERSLNYSRTFEYEADRLGMQLMVAAGYDPLGMPQFFSHLQSLEGVSAGRVPEFLRTHPLTARRLSDALDRVAQYRGKYRGDSREFLYAKARLEALANPQRVLAQRAARTPSAIEEYRQAVALTQTGGGREAVRILKVLPGSGEEVAVGLALAEAYMAQGGLRQAIATLEALSDLHPGRGSIAYHLADALLRADKPQGALKRLRPFGGDQHAPAFKKLMSRAAAAEGRLWLSHKHLADYYQANGNMHAALDQLKLAEKDPRINSLGRALIKAERSKVEKLQKAMEERI